MQDLKTELWAAASEAFPDPAEVQIKPLAPGHAKLVSRKLPAQYLVRVSNLTAQTFEMRHVTVREEGKDVLKLERVNISTPYAVVGMYPQDGSVEGIQSFIDDLKSDATRMADSFPK